MNTTALTTNRPDFHPALAPLAVALARCKAAARGVLVFARAVEYGGRTYVAVMELTRIVDDPPPAEVPGRDDILRRLLDAWWRDRPHPLR